MGKAKVLGAVIGFGVVIGAGVAYLHPPAWAMNMMFGLHKAGIGQMHMFTGFDTTEAESLELRDMFADHTKLTRTVENLPDGIRTTTESTDPALRDALVNHVIGMIDRVDQQRDPQIPIQSPTLDILFRNAALIVTEIDPTDSGVIVTQTSSDPATVAALQKHAGEVSDLAARGLDAAHESMMQRHHGG